MFSDNNDSEFDPEKPEQFANQKVDNKIFEPISKKNNNRR